MAKAKKGAKKSAKKSKPKKKKAAAKRTRKTPKWSAGQRATFKRKKRALINEINRS